MTEDERFLLTLIEKYSLDQLEDAYINDVYQRLKEQIIAQEVIKRFDRANESDNAG